MEDESLEEDEGASESAQQDEDVTPQTQDVPPQEREGEPRNKPWLQRLPAWARELIDPVAIITLGGAFLYLLGALHYYAYFRSLGLPEEEIVLSVPSYITRGALSSPLPLLLMGILIYEGLREGEGGWWTGLANGVAGGLLVLLALVLLWVTPSATALGVIPGPVDLLSRVWAILAVALAVLTALVGLSGRSMVRAFTREPVGRLSVAAISLLVLLVVPSLHGAGAAQSLMKGDEGRVASVHFEGTQEPWEPDGRLYHIITHDSKFYLIHVWKEDGAWNEAIHVLPQDQIDSLVLVEPGTNASTASPAG